MDAPAEKGSHGEHHRAGTKLEPHLRAHAGDAFAIGAGFQNQVVDRLLEQVQVRLCLHRLAHGGLIQQPVRLGSGGAHGRSLAPIEDAEMDTRAIGRPRHQAAEGVDLLHQVALADTADRRVAAHLADGLDVVRQQQRARAAACRRQGRLGAGMAAAHHDHVILPFCQHGSNYLRS